MASSTLPPDLFDTTTLISLASTLAILAVAYGTSLKALAPSTPGSYRFLFIWHLFDAGIHFFLEGSFLYHCLFSWKSLDEISAREAQSFYPTARGYLGHDDRVWGSQAAGDNPFAQLWMVYARADKRWAGADTGVISLELLTVLGAGPLACLVCYDIAKKNPRANILMTIIATAEIYGGFMTFCPEWLTGNQYLDGSNFMYMWVYLVFFNMLWVFIPAYAIYVSWGAFSAAFQAQAQSANGAVKESKKSK